MRLSEAIRLGAMLKPQAFGDYWSDGGSCALGAACDAAGVPRREDVADYENQFIDIFSAPCPACGKHPDGRSGEYKAGFCNTVIHLNDAHRWTRERIADWIATIEAQQEAETSPVVEQVEVG